MSTTLCGISSMATRHVLGALAAAYTERTGVQVQVESVGGVDAAQRVANGEVFDWVALGEGSMQGLMEQGYLVANSLVPVVASPTAVAVAEDAAVP
ncbi:MAG: substrate-binding domain-containing protein, partial [Burkholderiaceae bacterium]